LRPSRRRQAEKSELDAAQSEFVEKIAGTGTVRLLVLLENVTGWERNEAWGETDFSFSHRNDFERIAVVGNPSWEPQVLAFTRAGLRKRTGEVFSRNSRVRGARLVRRVTGTNSKEQHLTLNVEPYAHSMTAMSSATPRGDGACL
jgi:hypothetical protein